ATRCSGRLSLILFAAVVGAALAPCAAWAATLLINNGSAPPNPANYLANPIATTDVSVTDVGCGFADEECSNPAAPTTVALIAGGEVNNLLVLGNSHLDMSGGEVHGLSLVTQHSASVVMSDGHVVGLLEALGSSHITFVGGLVD